MVSVCVQSIVTDTTRPIPVSVGILHLMQMAEMIPDGSLTPHAQAMPDEYKCIDPG
jgi:hypothetical protein